MSFQNRPPTFALGPDKDWNVVLSNAQDSKEEEGQELEKEEEPKAAPWSKQEHGSSSPA